MYNIIGYTDGACEKLPQIGGWGWIANTSKLIGKNIVCNIEWSDCGGLDDTTNQQMELMAMAELLEFCKLGSNIEIWSDSTYTLKGMIGNLEKNPQENNLKSFLVTLKSKPQGWLNGWKTSRSLLNVKYVPYKNNEVGYWNSDRLNGHEWYRIHQRLLAHIEGKSVVKFGWVKGHSGIEGNELADKLADTYMNSKSIKEMQIITNTFIKNNALKNENIDYDKLNAPYYAVRIGLKPGIYRTWDTCNLQVNGYRKAEYKKFETLSDANKFMAG